MEAYYRERATEYEHFYEIPEWRDDLSWFRAWLADCTAGRTILEVAAGTAYWTDAAAPAAKAITVTDYNPEMLELAANRLLGPHVTLLVADAHALPELTDKFDTGMAHLWWSHLEKQRQQQFLFHFTSRLQPRATLLMIDQTDLEGLSYPTFRRDRFGNRYELRVLENGSIYQIVKNYPTLEELEDSLASVSDDIYVMRRRYFWGVRARIRSGASKYPPGRAGGVGNLAARGGL
jgi:SAM-dependent methyltransferase